MGGRISAWEVAATGAGARAGQRAGADLAVRVEIGAAHESVELVLRVHVAVGARELVDDEAERVR